MTLYIGENEERVLLDTSKAFLRYEENEIDLTGKKLSLYDAEYVIVDGTVGEHGEPCKVMVFTDKFTGISIEIPILLPVAQDISDGMNTTPPKERRLRLLKSR